MTTRSIIKSSAKILIAVIFFTNSRVFAQLNSDNLIQYTEVDGLPGSQTSCVLTDRFGYVWIGTINGLARFDGYEFKRFYYNPNDTASIRGLNVWSLFEDRKGKIWVGTGPSFLNVYDPGFKTFRHYEFTHLIKHAANVEVGVSAICEDNNGRMYFGINTNYGETISAGLLYKDKDDDTLKRFVAPDSLGIQNVYNIIKDQSGNMWLLSYNGLFKIDTNGKLSQIHSSASDEFRKNGEGAADIKFDKDGNFWIISTQSRLYKFNIKDTTYKVYTPPGITSVNSLNKIAFDKYDNIWMGTGRGLISFNRQTNQFALFKNESKQQLEKAAISDLHFDGFGTLWMSTASKGLLKYEERAVFRSYSFNKDDKNSITAGWANPVYEAHDGKIWIATSTPTNNGGINALDLKTNTINSIPYSALLPGAFRINAIFENSSGEFLLNINTGTIAGTGTYRFFTKTNEVKKIVLDGVPDNIVVNQFYNDSRGNLWLCTSSGLYEKIKGAETFKRFDLSIIPGSDASSNEITKALESRKHGLWLATNNGLFLYNYTNDKIERHGYNNKAGDIFNTQDVNSFYEDRDGILWAGTWQGGLCTYDVETKKIKTYTQNDGLPSMSVQGIIADEKNNSLWLSTFDGLSRLDLKTKQFNNFSIADGIQGQLFADGAYLRTTNGLFIFGGSNGLTIFNPDDINKNSIPPKIFLTDVKLFNKSLIQGEKSILKKPVYETKEIVLNYNQNNLSIEYLAIHYANPSKNKYAYKLENYDNDWRDVGNQRIAFYSNLPPGNYIFRVKAANNNGVWNEEGAALSIIVNAPWWKTTWAYILYALLFIAGVFAINRYVHHRFVQKERERNQARELEQAKEIEKAYFKLEQTHETLKATQSQLIQSEKMASLGELTAGIAHEIQNPLNFVNNFSELNKELLEEMSTEIEKRNYGEVQALVKDVSANEEKINHHGKRAEAIVKAMLQHSRGSIGAKELTNINKLADDYLQLAYHNLCAKDESLPAGQAGFHATLQTDFDESIRNINIIPQDIGRVLLNLYNNAFYAVNEKARNPRPLNGSEEYEPIVSVVTKAIKSPSGNLGVLLTVRDNGNGIPQKVVDKIFQPFFTTKPTGEGTGLGLSLSYDIIKAHGGEIKVETREGEGSEFIIKLPVA